MVISTLQTHWQLCQALRHGTPQVQAQALTYFRGVRVSSNIPVIQKAVAKVDLDCKKKAS